MFPVLLDLTGKRAVVFGGGKIANRRVMKLLDAGAKVTVVSRDFHPGLKRRKVADLKLVKREIKKGSGFIENSDIVLIATDDTRLNDRLEKEARMLKKIVNRADVASDFIIPATIRTGDVTVSISTGGKSPAVAKSIKKRIKRVLLSEDQYLIDIEEFAREKLKKTIKNQNRREKFLRELINRSDIIEKMKNGDVNGAKRILETMINAYDKH
ncbi:MAG: bifunctional precorrin-2 dehydrogenase/sirohydrochlorin ferrochelatase [Candidatus Hydrothermarchaeaceae archaeon]